MNTEEFIKHLAEVEDLLKQEKYVKSLQILSKLKEIEIRGDFDNSLTHKLYQLISNAESLLNQKRITNGVLKLAETHEKIDFEFLSNYLRSNMDLDLEPEIVRREIELLILRGKIPYIISDKSLVFSK